MNAICTSAPFPARDREPIAAPPLIRHDALDLAAMRATRAPAGVGWQRGSVHPASSITPRAALFARVHATLIALPLRC